MSTFETIVKGIWSAVCIAAEVAWDYATKWWEKSSETQKSVMLAVVIILVALGSWQVARAENQPASGYGLWFTQDGEGGAMACFMDNPTVDTVGSVYTCMAMRQVGPSTFMTGGYVAFCTITGVEDDKPVIDCAPTYQGARTLAGGI